MSERIISGLERLDTGISCCLPGSQASGTSDAYPHPGNSVVCMITIFLRRGLWRVAYCVRAALMEPGAVTHTQFLAAFI